MEPERTELTWTYEPADFFEAPYQRDFGGWRLSIEEGRAVATVTGARPSEAVESQIADVVKSVFQVRAMQTRKPFRLAGCANQVEFRGDRQSHFLRVGVKSVVFASDQLDVQLIDAATGDVIGDTKAERIASHKAELDGLPTKAQQNPTLRRMLASYETALNDPANGLTHLYEIRDALAKHFGSDAAAKTACGIGSSQWSTYGRLANEEPLLEGRHRGKNSGPLRHATDQELATVRDLAQDWIRKFAGTL